MTNNPMTAVNGLYNYFDNNEIKKLIEDYIATDDFEPSQTMSEYINPLFDKYKDISSSEFLDSSEKSEYDYKFKIVCTMIIDAICNKFDLSIDEGWFEEREIFEIQNMTLILFNFFISNLFEVLIEVLMDYIDNHINELNDLYGQDIKTKRGSDYLTLEKTVNSKYAVVGASVFDVCLYALDSMTEEDFFKFVNPDYECLDRIVMLYDDGHVSGNFLDPCIRMLKANSNKLLSKLAFEIISNIRINYKKESEEL